jgi:hypothetical protein
MLHDLPDGPLSIAGLYGIKQRPTQLVDWSNCRLLNIDRQDLSQKEQ